MTIGVTHYASSAISLSDRIIWLDQGKMVADGPPKEVVGLYTKWVLSLVKGKTQRANAAFAEAQERFPAPGLHAGYLPAQ